MTHTISVVVPVYHGEHTLPGLIDELLPYTKPFRTEGGHEAIVSEILLVHDRGKDASPEVMRTLAAEHEVVRAVWLSRNYGQHAATLAGMASSGGDWVVTMDEDGQHDPAYLGQLLDTAMAAQATVVYAEPSNPPPHGPLRNLASKTAKRVVGFLGAPGADRYNSYRLMLGEVARGVAAYAGAGVYLDVALSWVAGDVATCPVALREERGRPSGYSYRGLMSHFLRMILTGGTRSLRIVSALGLLFALAGVVVTVVLVVGRITGGPIGERGWTSTMVVVLLATGAILFSLGVVAEYVGVAVRMAMGKPLYMIVRDPASGPLGRSPEPDTE